MTACNGCGRCCDPVTLPFSRFDVLRAPKGTLSERDRRWILDELVPIKRRQGLMETADYLTQGGQTWCEDSTTHEPVILFTQFFRCPHYDPETRQCGSYDDRPSQCAGYPWYDDPPDPNKNIPPECSFRADVGRPVLLTRKPPP